MWRFSFLFYILIEFLPGHASITLDPRCKVPTGQHILSIGPGYGLAPNATVTAEVSNKTIFMLWMCSYITVYYLTSSKLEWNKDSLQREECWVTADAECAVRACSQQTRLFSFLPSTYFFKAKLKHLCLCRLTFDIDSLPVFRLLSCNLLDRLWLVIWNLSPPVLMSV